ERGEALEEPREPRLLPHQLDIGDPPGHIHEVERSVAHDLVRDAQVAAARVPGLRTLHVALSPPEQVEPSPATRPCAPALWARGSSRRRRTRGTAGAAASVAS